MGQKKKKRNGMGVVKQALCHQGRPRGRPTHHPQQIKPALPQQLYFGVQVLLRLDPWRLFRKKMEEYRGGLLVHYIEPKLQKTVLTEFTDDIVTSAMRQKAMQVALESEDWQRVLDHPKVTDYEFQDSYTLLPHTTVSQFHEEGGMILVGPRDNSHTGLLELKKDLKTRVAGLEVEVETREEMCFLREEMTSLREQMATMAMKVKTTEEKVSSLQDEIAKMKVEEA